MFTYSTLVRVGDADPAGVLFFAKYFALAHEAYEAFMESRGINLGRALREDDLIMPIVHAQSDYRAPLWAGERVTITAMVEEVRRRKFTIAYEFRNSDGNLACAMRTVHVFVDKRTRRASPLPEHITHALKGSA